LAWTSTDLSKVRAARLRGVRTVQYADRTVTYTSDDEMRSVEHDIARELSQVSGRRKQFTVLSSKGF
jgi:hypothetical protein